MFNGSILTCNFNDLVNKHCRACLPVPHLTTDGFLSACYMALFGKDKNHMLSLIYGERDEINKTINYKDDKIEYVCQAIRYLDDNLDLQMRKYKYTHL